MSGKAIRETLAALGVIASMVFVGLEIQQNNKLARGQARQALAELNQDWLVLMAGEDMNALWEKVWASEEELARDEWLRGSMLMTLQLRRMENVFFQWREGLVDESALGSYGLQTAARDFAVPRFKLYWVDEDWRSGFDPGFVEFLENQALN